MATAANGDEEPLDEELFSQYPKMASSSAKWGDASPRELRKTDWAVTEKLHGANMCFVLRPGSPSPLPCSRRRLLRPGDPFFSYGPWLQKNTPCLLRLLELASSLLPPSEAALLRAVSVFGELYGGHYPHPAVPACPLSQPVQPAVCYSPTVSFAVFDVLLAFPSHAPFKARFLPFATACSLASRAGLEAVPLLLVTPHFHEAVNYPLPFASFKPAALSLPPLPSAPSAEGVVVRPYSHELLLPNGSRALLKLKCQAFVEDSRLHEHRAPSHAPPQSSRSDGGPDSQRLLLLGYECRALLCDPRLEAALSKMGPLTPHEPAYMRELLRTLVADVLEEAAAATPAEWASLSPEQHVQLRTQVRRESKELINQYYLKHPSAASIRG